jgi:hypothetical protein
VGDSHRRSFSRNASRSRGAGSAAEAKRAVLKGGDRGFESSSLRRRVSEFRELWAIDQIDRRERSQRAATVVCHWSWASGVGRMAGTAGWLEEMMCPSVCGRDGSVKNNDPILSMMDRGLLNFNGVPALNCKCTASRFDPEPMRGSQAGMTAATAGGQPITSGRRSSTRKELQDRYAKNCASSAHAMPKVINVEDANPLRGRAQR